MERVSETDWMPSIHSFENEFTGMCYVILNAMFRRVQGTAAHWSQRLLNGIEEKVSVYELGCDAYKHIVFIFFLCTVTATTVAGAYYS